VPVCLAPLLMLPGLDLSCHHCGGPPRLDHSVATTEVLPSVHHATTAEAPRPRSTTLPRRYRAGMIPPLEMMVWTTAAAPTSIGLGRPMEGGGGVQRVLEQEGWPCTRGGGLTKSQCGRGGTAQQAAARGAWDGAHAIDVGQARPEILRKIPSESRSISWALEPNIPPS
jgi:hypothetical protein